MHAYTVEPLYVKSGQEVIAADFYRPKAVEKPAVILMAHGLAALRQFKLVQYAKRFAQAGYAVVLFDYRYWGVNEKVEWENILYAIRNVDGVRYVSDAYFLPNSDINITNYKLPRVRGFIVRDLDGGVLSDNYNVTNNFVWTDYFFPNTNDDNFQQSVIKNIS